MGKKMEKTIKKTKKVLRMEERKAKDLANISVGSLNPKVPKP
jgi:hypothetical protein